MSQVFVFEQDHRALGVACIEPITMAYRVPMPGSATTLANSTNPSSADTSALTVDGLLSPDQDTRLSTAARLGVRKLWVHPRAQRRGIAALLLDQVWVCGVDERCLTCAQAQVKDSCVLERVCWSCANAG
jgi:hypothetical protein